MNQPDRPLRGPVTFLLTAAPTTEPEGRRWKRLISSTVFQTVPWHYIDVRRDGAEAPDGYPPEAGKGVAMRVVTWEELASKASGSSLFGAWLHHAGEQRSISSRLDLVLLDEKVAVETAHHILFLTPSDRGYCDLTVIVGDKLLGNPALVGKEVSLDLLRIEGLEDEEPIATVSSDGTVTYSWTPISRLYDLREEVLLTVR